MSELRDTPQQAKSIMYIKQLCWQSCKCTACHFVDAEKVSTVGIDFLYNIWVTTTCFCLSKIELKVV